MVQEVSAGGVVVREQNGARELAIIRPSGRKVWALPKGHVDPGENPAQAAEREVREETGLMVELLGSLGEVRYTYHFRGKLVAKTVSFFLFRYRQGTIDALDPKMRHEVDEARWVPLDEANRWLSFPGELDMVSKARTMLV